MLGSIAGPVCYNQWWWVVDRLIAQSVYLQQEPDRQTKIMHERRLTANPLLARFAKAQNLKPPKIPGFEAIKILLLELMVNHILNWQLTSPRFYASPTPKMLNIISYHDIKSEFWGSLLKYLKGNRLMAYGNTNGSFQLGSIQPPTLHAIWIWQLHWTLTPSVGYGKP